ncbi:MAG: lipopolysaccharide A protein [Moritella sp.]|uniref:glycosyl transferase family 90 n=1 Tax=Moritella sp. TaxID=78556 RepID=UPI0025F86C83|nr:glycosyl transferase family 90 [Moritella sp.]NQZ93983.1 lipopolysaccharide A protein [Moritella sp.]
MLKYIKKISNKKNNKVVFYLKNIALLCAPSLFFRVRLKAELERLKAYDHNYIKSRVDYYNQINDSFDVSSKSVNLDEFKSVKKKTYFFDLYKYVSFFDRENRFDFIFGDVIHVPKTPSFVKSRPVSDNANSILMKLNEVRHFLFISDKLDFVDKKPSVVWRGGAYRDKRRFFVKRLHKCANFDIGQTNKPVEDVAWQKPFLSIEEQLQYKFIFCIEGNDVATNLKWVMSSNSIAVMPKPQYETWFMEGSLKAGVHYIEVKDDFSDAEEKIDYYSNHIDEANTIIKHANDYVEQFKDLKREKLISLLVLSKYYIQSDQSAK